MCKLGGTFIPPKILEDLEPIKDNDQAVQDYGISSLIYPIDPLLLISAHPINSDPSFFYLILLLSFESFPTIDDV